VTGFSVIFLISTIPSAGLKIITCRLTLKPSTQIFSPQKIKAPRALIFFPRTRGTIQIRHPPEGLQAGALKPPEPLGIPCARMQPADMSFCTSAQPHSGHLGATLAALKVSSSKQWQQALH
jgi:hypothetical protein